MARRGLHGTRDRHVVGWSGASSHGVGSTRIGAFVEQVSQKFKGLGAVMPSQLSSRHDLGREVEELRRELSEAHRREAATAEVLEVVSRSAFNLQGVFDGLIESAVRLTDAEIGLIYRQDGNFYRAAAIYGASPELIEVVKKNPIPPTHQSATGRAVLERRVIHIEDVVDDPEYTWAGLQGAQVRTILAVPMLREDTVIGVIVTRRTRVQAFTDQQIKLVTNFAHQAVIAIENTRLFEEVQARTSELSASLEQQTATADVLKAISRSAFDVQKVLDTLIEAAVKLTGAKTGILRRREGDVYPLVASFGLKPEWHELIGQLANAPGRDTLVGRVTLEGRTVQIPDVFADPDFSNVEAARIIGFRANIGTPLHRDGQMIGYMAFQKETVGPFGTRQVELIETFANQAVIAIENTRLFEAEQARTKELQVRSAELSQSLEYQTAISNVLSVISRSPNQLQPVLDEIARTAANLSRLVTPLSRSSKPVSCTLSLHTA
jgi:GAF domain-containing protein